VASQSKKYDYQSIKCTRYAIDPVQASFDSNGSLERDKSFSPPPYIADVNRSEALHGGVDGSPCPDMDHD
jgi:hypothetical protein